MWPLYRQAVREYVCLKCCGVSHERRMYYHLRRLCERCYEIAMFAICRNQRSPEKNYVAKQTCEAYIMLRVLPMHGCIRLHVNAHKEIIRETTESTQTSTPALQMSSMFGRACHLLQPTVARKYLGYFGYFRS